MNITINGHNKATAAQIIFNLNPTTLAHIAADITAHSSDIPAMKQFLSQVMYGGTNIVGFDEFVEMVDQLMADY